MLSFVHFFVEISGLIIKNKDTNETKHKFHLEVCALCAATVTGAAILTGIATLSLFKKPFQ